jgi:hypothetical protein
MGDAVATPFFAAYAAVNVKQHVPIVLNLERPNYSKWKAFFTALCAKYGLLGHIDGTEAARPDDPTWSQPDACIRGWMYGSINDVVLDLAMEPNQDARALYVSVEALFQANKEPHAIVLGEEVHTMSQGDLSVGAFAQQMKQAAHALQEVGHTISPTQLVLNLLRGINPRFATTADIIAKSATNMLRVKELRLGTERKEASASALAASTTPSNTSFSCRSTPPPALHPLVGAVARAKGPRARVVAAATVPAALAVGVPSSSQHHQEFSAGARVLSRLVLGFAITSGPPRGPTSSSRGRRRSSSRGRRRRRLCRRTLPSRRPSSPRLPLRHTALQVAGIKPT